MKTQGFHCFALVMITLGLAGPRLIAAEGCNEALLKTEFSLDSAPAIPGDEARVKYAKRVIAEMRKGYGGTLVSEASPHPHLDTPEFVAHYLRAFACPGKNWHDYDYAFERIIARVSGRIQTLEAPWLDWDVWRAYLVFENVGHVGDYFEDGEIGGSKVMSSLDSARDLLWIYLDHNSSAILKDNARRSWWITQLTRDLEVPGGRPARRWFLLNLLCAADADRPPLETSPVKPVFASDGTTLLRQPHPLDPFLLGAGFHSQQPPLEEALRTMSREQKLGLMLMGIKAASLPPTHVSSISLEMSKWPGAPTEVINQESWSGSSKDSGGYEWGVRFFRPVGRRAPVSNVSFPPERTDGVFFFVFHRSLHVWPKAKMDAAVIQLLADAGLMEEPLHTALVKRGFTPLEVDVKAAAP